MHVHVFANDDVTHVHASVTLMVFLDAIIRSYGDHHESKVKRLLTTYLEISNANTADILVRF